MISRDIQKSINKINIFDVYDFYNYTITLIFTFNSLLLYNEYKK